MNNEIALLLKKCASTTSIARARQLHALLLTSGGAAAAQRPYALNNLVSMYGRCGSYSDSRLVFDRIPHRNIVSYNALISACSRTDQAAEVIHLFRQLIRENLRPNGSTFVCLLQTSSSLKNAVLGLLLHGYGFKSGFLNDVRVQTSLLGLYFSCGNLGSAEEVFESMVYKDAMSWNAAIFGFMENGKTAKGLQMFGAMANPDQFTYSMVLNACGKLRDSRNGKLAHGRSIVSGTCLDLPLCNAILDMYCNCGDMDLAFRVFQRIECPNLVSWNIIIAGYSEAGDCAKAMDLFVRLRREYSTATKPDEYTYFAVLSAMEIESGHGKPLHALIEKAGLVRSAYVGSALVFMYFSNGEAEYAHEIFHSVAEKDMVLWTDMVAGNSRIGNGEMAMEIFRQMLRERVEIDSYALSSAASASADLANQRQGEMIHSLAVKSGYDTEVSVCGAMVDMYAKVGDLEAAEMEFSQVASPDLRCWNSMLGGYGHHGKASEAFRAFDGIVKQGLKPDHVTFTSILAVCSHCGLVEEGKRFWDCMKEKGLEPGPKHYSCLITLLSRAGLLEEAENTIKESPSGDEHLELWRTLLSFSIAKGDLRIATRAAERIGGIDADDAATHTLVAKLHAVVGRWEGVAETRRKMRKPTVEKDPGLSWISVMNDVHAFSRGDQSHRRNEDVRTELGRLMKHSVHTDTEETQTLSELVCIDSL